MRNLDLTTMTLIMRKLAILVMLTVTSLYFAKCKPRWQTEQTSNASQTLDSGCTSKFLLPDRPFVVIWNHPSGGCEKAGVDLNLSAWNILENKGDAFGGDIIRIYYGLGHWPLLYSNGTTRANGGVPQRGDLFYHLTQVNSQIRNDITPGFEGVTVIDMESWRPIFGHNFDSLRQYQQVSIDIVKARYPQLNHTQVIAEATKEFDFGAELFFGKTLDVCSALRPGGHFGYYQFPRHWGDSTSNDKLAYLWKKSKGLFPEIYMSDKGLYNNTKKYIHDTVKETLRVYAKYSSPDTLILPYSLCNNNGTNFFSKENLSLAIGLPGQMGAAGVVLWGSSREFHTKNECHILRDYIQTTLGPYVKNLTEFLSACSASLCSSHGRCVQKDLESQVQQHRKDSNLERCIIHDDRLLATGKVDGGAKTVGNKQHKEVFGQDGVFGHKGSVHSLQFAREEEMRSTEAKEENKWVRYLENPQAKSDVHIDSMGGRDDDADPYDHYVCRCLFGWSGDHCQNPV